MFPPEGDAEKKDTPVNRASFISETVFLATRVPILSAVSDVQEIWTPK